MAENYKDIIYNNYHSIHTRQLYGNTTLESIRKQFPVMKYYYSEFLPKGKSLKILDAGCGNGSFVFWLNEFGYTQVSGIDISKEMVDLGKSLDIKNIFQGDLFEHLKNNKNNYDFIFCRDVLEHFTKPKVFEMFNLFYNSLKTGGNLVVQVPNGCSPNFGKIFFRDLTHETLFSDAVLNQLKQSIGFNSIYIKEITPVPRGIFSGIRFALWFLLKRCYMIIQLIENGNSKGFYSQNIIACLKR